MHKNDIVVHRTERLCNCPKRGVRQPPQRPPHPLAIHCLVVIPVSGFQNFKTRTMSPVWYFRIKNSLFGCRIQRSARGTARCRMALWWLRWCAACPVCGPRARHLPAICALSQCHRWPAAVRLAVFRRPVCRLSPCDKPPFGLARMGRQRVV